MQAVRAKEGSLNSAEYTRPRYFHIAPAGVTVADVQEPEYWSDLVRFFNQQPWALIEVVSATGNWEALLRVYAITADNGVKTRLLMHWASADQVPSLPRGYNLEPQGCGWRVVNPAGETVKAGVLTETEAVLEARADSDRWAKIHPDRFEGFV